MDVVSYLLGKNASGGGGGGGEYNLKIDTSNMTSSILYSGISQRLVKLSPDLDTSQITDFRSMFLGCSSLTEIPETFNTSNAKYISNMFESCTSLTTIPVLDFSSVTTAEKTYKDCPNFTDETLDNILLSLASAKITISYYKKLSEQGFSSSDYSSSRIQALPHYQDFVDAGWSIGY